MSVITVQQATIFDLVALVPLFECFRQFHGCNADALGTREFLRQRLNHGESAIFMALQDGSPVGFVQLYPSFSSLSLTRTFVMDDLFVLTHARRKGAALRLMTAAVDYAIAVGAEKISLSIAEDNQAAQALYSSTGWELQEQSLGYCFMVPSLVETET